jgi:hypothetical protein
VQCRAPLSVCFFALRLLRSVCAQQIMKLEAIRCCLFEQVGADKVVQELPRSAERKIREGSRRVEAELRRRMDSQQAEEPGGVLRKSTV